MVCHCVTQFTSTFSYYTCMESVISQITYTAVTVHSYTIAGINFFVLLLPSIAIIVIDGYTRSGILTSGDSVPLGTQLLLVCQVVGLPYGTPLSYTWTCPNGPCEVEGYYGRKIYNQHILAVNTTSTSDGGTYTCQVTATGDKMNQTFFHFSLGLKGEQMIQCCKGLSG